MNTTSRSNEYRIYIRSNKNPRTLNTPNNGRAYFSVIVAHGKQEFSEKLNELIANGEKVLEVRKGYGGHYVKYWEYIRK